MIKKLSFKIKNNYLNLKKKKYLKYSLLSYNFSIAKTKVILSLDKIFKFVSLIITKTFCFDAMFVDCLPSCLGKQKKQKKKSLLYQCTLLQPNLLLL